MKKYNNSYYEYYCNYLFPLALEYGMSADEFWKDDPQLFVSYRISFINKKKKEVEENDYKSWLQGLYIHEGNGILGNSLKQFLHNIVAGFTKSSKDNNKLPTYPKKPYMELEKEKQQEIKQQQKEQKYQKFEEDLRYFGRLKKSYLEKLEKKGE